MKLATAVLAGIGAIVAGAAHAQAPSVCPDNFEAFAGTTAPLVCTCTAEAVEREAGNAGRRVLGVDIYAARSPICLAAVHAGVIGPAGGDVSVLPEAGQPEYAGANRNGVESRNFRAFNSSFRVAAAAAPAAPAPLAAAPAPAPTPPLAAAPAPAPAPVPLAAAPAVAAGTICPDDFVAGATTGTPLACDCAAEAIERQASDPNRRVFGMDIYTANSPVCLAAVHAGVIGPEGGAITITPEAGQQAYAGVTRNGIESRNLRQYDASFRLAAGVTMPAPAAAAGLPVQQPIAQTLAQAGEVPLYINFRFNSADLEPTAAPVLQELRDALSATPNMRLALVGHTDAVGGADYNRTLSVRRATSVRDWLVSQGIPADRLAVDGRGPDEPIADNATDTGRALNRRVQAVRLP